MPVSGASGRTPPGVGAHVHPTTNRQAKQQQATIQQPQPIPQQIQAYYERFLQSRIQGNSQNYQEFQANRMPVMVYTQQGPQLLQLTPMQLQELSQLATENPENPPKLQANAQNPRASQKKGDTSRRST